MNRQRETSGRTREWRGGKQVTIKKDKKIPRQLITLPGLEKREKPAQSLPEHVEKGYLAS